MILEITNEQHRALSILVNYALESTIDNSSFITALEEFAEENLNDSEKIEFDDIMLNFPKDDIISSHPSLSMSEYEFGSEIHSIREKLAKLERDNEKNIG